MYHGEVVPGFPQHPHRGFETVTIVRRGLIDHSDSLGAAARFGGGDVQWLTAGQGIVHAEMFPLLDRERPQPARAVPDLAQPARRATSWSSRTSRCCGTRTSPGTFTATRPAARPQVTVVAGQLGDARPPHRRPLVGRAPRERRGHLDASAWQPGARWTLPPAGAGHQPHALLLPRQPGCSVGRTRRSPPTTGGAAPRPRGAAGGGRRRGRAAAAAGAPHRRAGGAVRPLRDEHPRRDRSRRSSTTSAPASAAGPGPATRRCTRARPAASPATPTEESKAPVPRPPHRCRNSHASSRLARACTCTGSV